MAVEKKASQFKQNASIFYETSVYIILTLGPGSQGNLVEEKKETGQPNATTLYQTSCLQTLGPDCGKWKESQPIQAECCNFVFKQPWTALTLGPGCQGDLVEVEEKTWQLKQNAATLYRTARRMPKFCTVH